MLVHSMTARQDLQLDVLIRRGSLLIINRTRLVTDAKSWGADYILWLDADHFFPPDTLLRLLAHDKDIVGCNYARRSRPTGPSAVFDAEPILTTPEKVQARLVEEVTSMGLGVCLMRMSLLDAIEPPLFNSGIAADGALVGEDSHFFNRACEAGFKAWCDHALSWEIGHLYEATIWNAEAVADREQWSSIWEAARKKTWD
jgi:hypothetical protein